MRILVDGDGCPVISIVTEVAAAMDIELIVYTDLNHQHQLDYGTLKVVDQGFQSVDMVLCNNIEAGDLVITSDYGLAALSLSRKAKVLGFSGREFTDQNIERLLAKRHRQFKERKRSGRHTSHKKRTEADDQRFKNKLLKLLNKKQ
ncbi:YaiI/YqxD family protein [Halanaerobium saccharolyticum]|uniref:YaiI/YqxD family protein n=1 Tax=Halanaerobium saccharolyticum TaxID=43595 RepID=UPI003FCE532E